MASKKKDIEEAKEIVKNMASTNKKTNKDDNKSTNTKPASDDFSIALIKDLNKEAGSQIAFNLSIDDAPTNISKWIGTGSKQLDYIISNRKDGGLPVGRIVELQGLPGSGKSSTALEIVKATQKDGGIAILIDTETATNLDNLIDYGIDVYSRFIFVQTSCTEEIFSVVESTILKARAMTKDIPVTIVWDSVAASSPRAELEGDYDQNTIGLQARVLGKGMRKIANLIGNQRVLFLLINQNRMVVGTAYGDPYCVSPDTIVTIRTPIKDNNNE